MLRLAIGETLGIDATIRYAEKQLVASASESQLDKDTPYNTRVNSGRRRRRSATGAGRAAEGAANRRTWTSCSTS